MVISHHAVIVSFVASTVIYLGLVGLRVRHEEEMQDGLVAMAMCAAYISVLFVRGSIVGDTAYQSMALATFANVTILVVTLGNPAGIFDRPANVARRTLGMSPEEKAAYERRYRRTGYSQAAFILVGIVGLFCAFYIDLGVTLER